MGSWKNRRDFAGHQSERPQDKIGISFMVVQPVHQGDINGDGGITISDGVLLQQYILGKGSFDEFQLKCADLTGDDYVDVYDMIIIRKKLTE